MTGRISLRPATSDDGEFLHRVYASTRNAELAMTDWTDAQKDAFCLQQSVAQSEHYTKHYPGAEFLIIERDGQPAGRLYVVRWPAEIRIMDIVLLPEHCGHGIGSRLLQQLQTEAANTRRSLSIHVEKFNPALRLYQRLGFREKEDKGVYLLLEWTAA